MGLLPGDSLKRMLLNHVKSYNGQECKFVGNFFHRGTFRSLVFPISWLGQMQYIPFEDIELPVPEKLSCYLRLRFGQDYMDIPEAENRHVSPHYGKQ